MSDSIKGKKCEPGADIFYVQFDGEVVPAKIVRVLEAFDKSCSLFVFGELTNTGVSVSGPVFGILHDQVNKRPGTWHW